MGKKSKKRNLPDNCAMALDRSVRSSSQKLNLVAESIRGMEASKALVQLEFSKKRIASDVKKVLQSAIANAENNHNLDIDKLVVSEAYVGKALVMKRFRPRARGRGGKILKPISNLTVIVKEENQEEV
ncbi:MAG: 50S ribosomal protein L22 [Pelagibacterales bacterium]|nr:50S ribosomal protein L22 [Pelagibacterales bacterium]PPR15316.1 MAG: 50S ribosomal protein L22 [Alphaproteobacteria bacterium MarineAlpha9_Bin3]|tara:strand:+ start:3389 stop:3772 length:384 start_codon:yes stop_codon:yes gene_type:complete